MDLTDCYNYFVQKIEEEGKTESTVTAYSKDIEQFVLFLKNIKIYDINSIEESHIHIYIENLSKNKLTPNTISRKVKSLNKFYELLISINITGKNPIRNISSPKIKKLLPRVLSEIEYRALRDTCKDDIRLYTIIELMLQTGIRIGELARLKIYDANIDDSYPSLFVQQFGINKERFIPLNQRAVSSLKNYLKIRTAGNTKTLFTTKTGRGLLVRNIRQSINSSFDKAGIKNAKVNDLRNTFIVHNLNNGASIIAISKIVGHKRVSTTERYLEMVDSKKYISKTKLEEL